ncbi:MAG: UDP-N-acetylmuramate--L-alanine ligase [Lachnospiraceae bacterium]|nr:UDP-N-acetylmuramate--L-alanine ligase [Lachnospiraceae bacterium]
MFKLDFSKPINVHFMGIGGISMSGLAEILADRGFKVSGSDRAPSKITEALEKKGITIKYGQVAENITDDIELLVYTAAISADNEELMEAKRRGIECIPRADMLGQIMKNYEVPIAISGTHGKTTTTSMITTILMEAALDPTVTVGGMLDCIGGNLRIGKSEVFVTEACEYTNSFLSFFPKISIILNVEEDHMDFFKDINDIRNSFRRFAELLPEDGLLVISADIDNYEEICKNVKCKVVTFGTNPDADYTAKDVVYSDKGYARFNVVRSGNLGIEDAQERIELSVPGAHNVTNALASVAVADFIDVDRDSMLEGFKTFHGADRRFQIKGEVNGFTVVDDYAHHPTEIRATLNAAKNYKADKVTVVFQPHTYTRTKAFFDDFVDALMIADTIVLADIYAAREKNTIGISSKDLETAMKNKGADAHYFEKFEEIEKFILANCKPGEMLITMGAGNVDIIGDNILSK